METAAAVMVVPLSVSLRLSLASREKTMEVSWWLELVLLSLPIISVVTDICRPVPVAIALGFSALSLARWDKSKESTAAAFRVATALATGVCVLGVDFPSFPNRYAKTNGGGLSLMDLGTAATVFGDGLRSPAAPKMKRALLLFGLAAARSAFVATTGYPEPEPEYQRGWNFFWTLACIEAASLLGPIAMVFLSLTLPSTYPGLATVPGYLVVNLAARAFFSFKMTSPTSWLPAALTYLAVVDDTISRSEADLGYVLASVALSIIVFNILRPFATFWHRLPATSVLNVIRRHRLAYFLVINLLCGAVNFTMHTNSVTSRFQAALILFAHTSLAATIVKFDDEQLLAFRSLRSRPKE